MALDFELLKKHPYATGGVVIVGGLIVFYLLSSSQSSVGGSASVPDDTAAVLSADEQEAQIQAGASVQNQAQQVALQTAQLQAQVANTQTAASVQINDVNTAAQLAAALENGQIGLQENNNNNSATITEQANQLLYAQNIQQMQDSVLEDQINSGVYENANNNATALAGAQVEAGVSDTIAGYQTQVALQGLQDTYNLTSQQQTSQDALAEQGLTYVFNRDNPGLASPSDAQIAYAAGASGNTSVGTALAQAQAANQVAQAQEQGAAAIASANEVSSIAKSAGGVLTGIFG